MDLSDWCGTSKEYQFLLLNISISGLNQKKSTVGPRPRNNGGKSSLIKPGRRKHGIPKKVGPLDFPWHFACHPPLHVSPTPHLRRAAQQRPQTIRSPQDRTVLLFNGGNELRSIVQNKAFLNFFVSLWWIGWMVGWCCLVWLGLVWWLVVLAVFF